MKAAAGALVLLLASCTPAACEEVSPEVRDGISEGLTTTGQGTISDAAAVEHDGGWWLIAGEIDAPGLEGSGDVGVWALQSPPDRIDGLLIAVDSFAREFSEWGAEVEPPISPTDSAVDRARRCL